MCMWMPAKDVWEVVRFICVANEKKRIRAHLHPPVAPGIEWSLKREGHCGGLTWAPIGIGGSSITLRSTKADKTVTRTMSSSVEAICLKSMSGKGWIKFAKVADIKKKTWGLCVDDALKVSATIRVQRANCGPLSLGMWRHEKEESEQTDD